MFCVLFVHDATLGVLNILCTNNPYRMEGLH